jgi:tetratricopeptide (TPR) repeat protein
MSTFRGCLIFFGLVISFQVQSQNACTCESYDTIFNKYRLAKDAGDNSLAEQIALDLSNDGILYCRVLGLNLLANVKVNNSQMAAGLSLINRQRSLLDSMRCSSESFLEYYLTKSYYHYLQDEYDSSIANSIKALVIAEQTNSINRQITLRLGIGSAFYRIGQIEKKMEYSRSIIPLIEKVDDLSFKCQFYYNLFGAYYTYYTNTKHERPYLDSASLYNQKALQIARRTLNKRFLPYCYEALEIINHERNGSPMKGIVYLDSAIYYGRGSMNNAQVAELLINKANLFAEVGNKNQAIVFVDSGLYYSVKHPQKSVYASHLVDASDLYKKVGEHERALTLYREADTILDSIKSTENARMVRELEERYNKEKNEKTIKELSQEKEISKLQIRLLVLGVTIALVAIGFIIFVYHLVLLKQKQQTIESKYKLNQALINPHFLSNALVSIQRFMMENNPVQASNYLTKFSRLMRQLLEYSRQELITIEEEIEQVTNYLDIQKLRLKDRFQYEIRIDEKLAISGMSIPPMFVQPFVENAVEHGVINSEDGKIEVGFSLMGKNLLIDILDNGKGISVDANTKGSSLSTKIIQERIALLNKSGSAIQLQISNAKMGSGTHVKLMLPIS